MQTIETSSSAGLPIQDFTPRWYALYTRANHERRLSLELADRGIRHYLPSYESVRRWKDRRKLLRLPLFPGYVFVQIQLSDKLRTLQTAGAVRLVGFNGSPTPLPDAEIAALRRILEPGINVEPFPYLAIGKKFRIERGPFAGLEGKVLRHKKKWRVVLSIDLIQRSVLLDVDAADLEMSAVRTA